MTPSLGTFIVLSLLLISFASTGASRTLSVSSTFILDLNEKTAKERSSLVGEKRRNENPTDWWVSLSVVFVRVFSSPTLAIMPRAPYTEKGSCRYNQYFYGGNNEDMCLVCRLHSDMGDTTLRTKVKEGTEQIIGVCMCMRHDMPEDQWEEQRSMQIEYANQEEEEQRNSRSDRAVARRYVPGESETAAANSITEVRNWTTRHLRSANSEMTDRAAIAHLARKGGHDGVINVSRGGTSRRSRQKMAGTASAAFAGLSMVVSPMDPEFGMAAAIAGNISQKKRAKRLLASAVGDSAKRIRPTAQHRGEMTDATATKEVALRIAADAAKIANSQKQKEKDDALLLEMGPVLRDHIKKMRKPSLRRPFLAAFCKRYSQSCVERVVGIKIPSDEWNSIRKHQRSPGAFKILTKSKPIVSRARIPESVIKRLLYLLEQPMNLQKHAFGSKLLAICDGMKSVELAAVGRAKPMLDLVKSFVMALDSEAGCKCTVPDEDRCTKLEDNTMRRCMKNAGHGGKHKYTPKGSICARTVEELVGTLTTDEIRRFTGLDDIKIMKGNDNFNRMRELTEKLFFALDNETQLEKAEILTNIDKVELFHSTDFCPHLARNGTHKCNCLTCGFEQDGSDVHCDRKEDHLNPCTNCALGYSIVRRLEAKLEAVKGVLFPTDRDRFEYEEVKDCVINCRVDLDEYRSHLARLWSEAGEDVPDLNHLWEVNGCMVRCDYKMRILACYFRENQLKWYAKRGITCLGFMIISKAKDGDPDRRFDCTYVMFLTNDTLQDEWEVLCAKEEVYESHVPTDCKVVWFRTDGAGCFRNVLARAAQRMWSKWTVRGIVEERYRIDPAGGGHTTLDAMFGVLARVLHRGADRGNSYVLADEAVVAAESGGGMAATTFASFNPDRARRLWAKLTTPNKSLDSVLLTILNKEDGSITGYKHSGYGQGMQYRASDFSWYDKQPIVTGRNKTVPIDIESAQPPRCLDLKYGSDEKKAIKSYSETEGQGPQSASNIRIRRANRVESSCKKAQAKKKASLEAEQVDGLYVCKIVCPETGRYCEKTFLTRRGYERHYNGFSSEHSWQKPGRIKSKDRAILLASRPGGPLAVGTLPDRADKYNTFSALVACNDDNIGMADATCVSKFNRKEGQEKYYKTEKTLRFLLECFLIEPRLDGRAIQKLMIEKRDIDGTPYFCKLKAGEAGQSKGRADWRCSKCHLNPCQCNGKVLTVEQINSYISSLAKKRRENKLVMPADLVVSNHPDNANAAVDPEEQGADVNEDPMDESDGEGSADED